MEKREPWLARLQEVHPLTATQKGKALSSRISNKQGRKGLDARFSASVLTRLLAVTVGFPRRERKEVEQEGQNRAGDSCVVGRLTGLIDQTYKEEVMADKITTLDQLEATYKPGIGVEQQLPANYAEASKDIIQVFCDTIGDNNPLYVDEDYAKKGPYGMVTAPPTVFWKILSANTTLQVPPVPGAPHLPTENIGHLNVEDVVESYRPVCVGDRFKVIVKVDDVYRKQLKTLGPAVFIRVQSNYFNQHGVLAATVWQTQCMTVTRGGGEGGGGPKPAADKPGVVAKDANKLAFERKRRGAQPRYWEDVEVGQELDPLEKGVYTLTEMARYNVNIQYGPRSISGKGGAGGGNGMERQAAWRIHDFGMQRTLWLGQLCTDWAGDRGVLKRLWSQIRGMNLIGDINVCKGEVSRKYIANGEHLVDCDVFVENQGGIVTAPGRATIALPSKK